MAFLNLFTIEEIRQPSLVRPLQARLTVFNGSGLIIGYISWMNAARSARIPKRLPNEPLRDFQQRLTSSWAHKAVATNEWQMQLSAAFFGYPEARSLETAQSQWKAARLADNRPSLELVDLALTSFDDYSVNALWTLRYRATQEVFELAAFLCEAKHARQRQIGVCILSQLGVPEHAFQEEATKLLLTVLTKEEDEDVLLSLLYGFGHLGAQGCVAEIAALKAHPQADVRLAVVHAIMYEGSPAAVQALIFLSRDIDSEVRDWATFSLGAQSRRNNKALRNALADRLNDINADVRFEAICGLAERHDERAIAPLLNELAMQDVKEEYLEAVESFGTPMLYPALMQLKARQKGPSEKLDRAIFACRPHVTKQD
ncbi:MAG: HEAT repeat domain-containing protein [Candidatus Obscuribacterales bacterium]|nr:HEAT repeat domain-containing protein [Candidatus Obscuribacterales bacterium]